MFFCSSWMVQILNTHPQSGGMHWLTILTVGCPKDTVNVNVYDSAGGFIILTSVEKSGY